MFTLHSEASHCVVFHTAVSYPLFESRERVFFLLTPRCPSSSNMSEQPGHCTIYWDEDSIKTPGSVCSCGASGEISRNRLWLGRMLKEVVMRMVSIVSNRIIKPPQSPLIIVHSSGQSRPQSLRNFFTSRKQTLAATHAKLTSSPTLFRCAGTLHPTYKHAMLRSSA